MSILEAILDDYALDPEGIHGVRHWARVRDNGLRLAPLTGADPTVVTLFAIFHDSRRVNDWADPGHGRRGAELARAMRERHAILSGLSERAFDSLVLACALHTHATEHDDVTVATCFDADRLDLPRCGIVVKPSRLCTDAARDPAIIAWATTRSVADEVGESLEALRTMR